MPLWLPHDGDVVLVTNSGIVGDTNAGTSVTTGGTASTKGTAVEVISAANNVRDSWGITVLTNNYGASATASEGALDILIGGATDDVLIPNLLMGYSPDSGRAWRQWFFPLHIPAGVRLAAQAAGARTSTACRVILYLHGGSSPPFRVGRKVTTYGMGTVPNGTAVTPAASGGAASATQMTASTSEDHFAFFPSFQVAADTTIATTTNVNIGIGVGAATEERIGTWYFGKDANENIYGPFPCMPAFRDVPAGSRLTILASNGGANDSAQNAVIHAVS